MEANKHHIVEDWNFADEYRLHDLMSELRVKTPHAYTVELAIKVCVAVSQDPRPLSAICADNPSLPNAKLIDRWRAANGVFARNFNAAKKMQAQILIDEIIEIVDDPANCVPEILNWAKARVNTRQWLASKLIPKIYGDQKQIDDLTVQNNRMQEEVMKLRQELDAENKKPY